MMYIRIFISLKINYYGSESAVEAIADVPAHIGWIASNRARRARFTDAHGFKDLSLLAFYFRSTNFLFGRIRFVLIERLEVSIDTPFSRV